MESDVTGTDNEVCDDSEVYIKLGKREGAQNFLPHSNSNDNDLEMEDDQSQSEQLYSGNSESDYESCVSETPEREDTNDRIGNKYRKLLVNSIVDEKPDEESKDNSNKHQVRF